MAGTIYEGIRYVLFSNLLILSTIKVYKLIISVPKPSLQSFLSVTPTTIKILHKHTHVYTSIASFMKAGRIAKLIKLQCAFLQIHLLSISSPSNLYCLTPLQYTSSSPLTKLQTTNHLGHVLYSAMSPL
jgi:hypothetical protein